jgi:hypothetical protein
MNSDRLCHPVFHVSLGRSVGRSVCLHAYLSIPTLFQIDLGFDDSRTLMKALDTSGDGNIDYNEFISFVKPPSPSKAARPGASPLAAGKQLSISDRVAKELREKFDAAIDSGKIKSYEDVFKAMDKDGNGTVSRREFEDGLRDLRVHHCLELHANGS